KRDVPRAGWRRRARRRSSIGACGCLLRGAGGGQGRAFRLPSSNTPAPFRSSQRGHWTRPERDGRGARADRSSVNLLNQVAIITGGAAGLGLSYARRFLAEGARVVLADIVDAATALRELGHEDRVHAVRTDVASAAAVETMVAEAVQRFGRVDVLVNNAALFAGLAPTPFEKIDEAEWDRLMAVNVKGVWL